MTEITDYISLAKAHIDDLYPIISHTKPQISELPPGAILGTWAYSVPNKIRYILDPEKEIVRGVMPSDLTRAWIKDAFNLPIKLRKSQVEGKHFPLPILADKGEHGECCYVDIKAAYLTILRLGYDLEYEQGKYLCVNFTDIPEQIAKRKLSYAVAVAMSASKLTNIDVVSNYGVKTTHAFNVYSNPCLYALASDSLASIASEAMRVFGSRIHYINTDGFICDKCVAENLITVIRSWGFDARVKYDGQTEVYGVGSWKVGTTKTARFDAYASSFRSALPDKSQSVWLKRRLYKLNTCAILT